MKDTIKNIQKAKFTIGNIFVDYAELLKIFRDIPLAKKEPPNTIQYIFEEEDKHDRNSI